MAHDRGITDIFTDLLREFTSLFRQEMRLAKAEVSEKITMAAIGVGLVVGGALLLMVALILLLQAAVVLLIDQGFSLLGATLIVAGGTFLIGAILLWVGIGRLKVRNLTPKRTVGQLQRDATVARYQVSAP